MIRWNGAFFHSPSTYLIERVAVIHDYVILFLLRIIILVLLNLIRVLVDKSFNIEFYENHQLETVWTLVPFFLLAFIVLPSLLSLYMLDSCFFCGITVNIMGHQWYWSYFYKDIVNYRIDSYILTEDNQIRLLDVDNRLVVPTFFPVRFLLSSSDVLHSWTLPSFGVKIDAIPGRINQFCFSSKRSGIFFGQCSEICGANHRFMPIVIERIKFSDYVKEFLWLDNLSPKRF